MPERTGFAAGEPAWTDLMTSDVDAAGTFYNAIFGWAAEPVPMPDAGGYTMLSLDGRHVGGLSPQQPDDQGPPRWTVYLNVDDADKTAELAQNAGGAVVVPVTDVFGSGRMAVLGDPAGAAIAVWQPLEHRGAAVTDEVGALTWVELTTGDTAAAQAFYTEVFGWGAEATDGGGLTYTEFKLGDKSVAGMMPKPEGMPAEAPSFWIPYFQANPDKVGGEITALGGTVLQGPADIPGGGRYLVATDPQGATFGLYQPA